MKNIDGLVQERRNSSALAMELHLSCTKPIDMYNILNAKSLIPKSIEIIFLRLQHHPELFHKRDSVTARFQSAACAPFEKSGASPGASPISWHILQWSFCACVQPMRDDVTM